jgi:hypothetical protein
MSLQRRPCADGTYDSRENFSFLAKRGIEATIKVWKNSSRRARGCPARKRVALELMRDPESWKRRVGNGLRWMAESGFSAFKRLFGEHVMAISLSKHGQGDVSQGFPLQPLHELESITLNRLDLKESRLKGSLRNHRVMQRSIETKTLIIEKDNEE